jgi:hypothetical protein
MPPRFKAASLAGGRFRAGEVVVWGAAGPIPGTCARNDPPLY